MIFTKSSDSGNARSAVHAREDGAATFDWLNAVDVALTVMQP